MIAELQQTSGIQTDSGMSGLLRIIEKDMLVVSRNRTGGSSYRMSSRNVFESLGSVSKNHPQEQFTSVSPSNHLARAEQMPSHVITRYWY